MEDSFKNQKYENNDLINKVAIEVINNFLSHNIFKDKIKLSINPATLIYGHENEFIANSVMTSKLSNDIDKMFELCGKNYLKTSVERKCNIYSLHNMIPQSSLNDFFQD